MFILTKEDRKMHMAQAKKHYPEGYTEQGLEKLGNIAAVNCWYYQGNDGNTYFYQNTPDWIIDIARNLHWSTDIGNRILNVQEAKEKHTH